MTSTVDNSDDESNTIAIFLGADNSFNVQQTILGISEILSKQYNLDLVTTASSMLPPEVENRYNIFGAEYNSTFRGSYAALDSYLEDNEPIALSYIIRPPTTGTIAALLAKRHGVPFIYRHSGETFRDYTLFQGYSSARLFGLKNIIGRIPLKLADKYIVLGPAGKYQLKNLGIPLSEIHVLPPPIDTDRFKKPGSEIPVDIPDSTSVVLYVGRKSRLKGIESFERIIPAVIDKRPDIRFLFVGAGKTISVPDRYQSHVFEVGKVNPTHIPKYFQRADVLVHPSLTEGFGRVLVEALATETPILVRAVGDMPSITSNTFVTEDEMVSHICNYESLYINDAERFTAKNLQAPYFGLFEQFH